MRAYHLKKLFFIVALLSICGCTTSPVVNVRGNPNEKTAEVIRSRSQLRHIDVNRYISLAHEHVTTICAAPRLTVYDETDITKQGLRTAPYEACLAVSHQEISKAEYREFLKDFSALLLFAAGIEALGQLEAELETSSHRKALGSLATQNNALTLMCMRPDLFAVVNDVFSLCVVGRRDKVWPEDRNARVDDIDHVVQGHR